MGNFKRMRWLGVAVLMAIVITTGVSGCMIINQIDSMTKKATLKDRMMEYINGRYDDTFTYIEDFIFGYSDQRTIFVASEKYPGEEITVTCFFASGSELFNDNYLHFKYREQTIEAIQAALEEAFDYDLKLYYDYTRGVDLRIIPADATFDEYIGYAAARLGFDAVLSPGFDIGDRESLEEKLKAAFVSRGIVINNAVIWFCEDPDVYVTLDKIALPRFTFAYKGPSLYLRLTDLGNSEFSWRRVT